MFLIFGLLRRWPRPPPCQSEHVVVFRSLVCFEDHSIALKCAKDNSKPRPTGRGPVIPCYASSLIAFEGEMAFLEFTPLCHRIILSGDMLTQNTLEAGGRGKFEGVRLGSLPILWRANLVCSLRAYPGG